MRTYTFTVYFTGATQEVVTTGSPSQAVILACAERIKRGQHTNCYCVQNVDTNEEYEVNQRNTITVNYVK